jgi:hypothetical protein
MRLQVHLTNWAQVQAAEQQQVLGAALAVTRAGHGTCAAWCMGSFQVAAAAMQPPLLVWQALLQQLLLQQHTAQLCLIAAPARQRG